MGMARARDCRGRNSSGKELSYNNLVDLDAGWELVQELDQPAVGIT